MNLILFPSVMILKGYFLKRLPLAYGLCLSGAGVGMVSFPPFYVFLHTTFGIGGSFLICSAICMNCVVFACLTKPVASQSKWILFVLEIPVFNDFYQIIDLFSS